MSANFPLILFAKAPVAGKAKTRLSNALTPAGAAEVAKVLLRESIKMAVEYWQGEIVLAVTPDSSHPEFQKIIKQYPIRVIEQRGKGLGERMKNAMHQVGFPSVVMGCDVPQCTREILEEVYANLCVSRDCIGPTEDGGYYLLGLNSPSDYLFEEIQWGAEKVFEKTLYSAKQKQQVLFQLPKLRDVDEIDDLQFVAEKFLPLQGFLN